VHREGGYNDIAGVHSPRGIDMTMKPSKKKKKKKPPQEEKKKHKILLTKKWRKGYAHRFTPKDGRGQEGKNKRPSKDTRAICSCGQHETAEHAHRREK